MRCKILLLWLSLTGADDMKFPVCLTSWYLAMPPLTAASMTPFSVMLSRLMLPCSCLCWYWLIKVRSSWFLFSTTEMAFSNGLTSTWERETQSDEEPKWETLRLLRRIYHNRLLWVYGSCLSLQISFMCSPALSSPPQTSGKSRAEGGWGSESSFLSTDSEKHDKQGDKQSRLQEVWCNISSHRNLLKYLINVENPVY